MNQSVIAHYDSCLYTSIFEEYTGQSGYANFGFWDGHTADAKQASYNLIEKLLAYVPDKSGTILDIACGKGGTTKHLLKFYPPDKVTAINISAKQLETARQNAPGCNFLVMDATALEFTDNFFDNIICVESAFHFRTREKFLREALRVLKPGGGLVLSDVLMKKSAAMQMRLFHEENYLPDPEAYRALCREIGFSEVNILDATKSSWEGHFWNMIHFMHAKYFAKEIDREMLKLFLQPLYKIAVSLQHYLLVGLRKASPDHNRGANQSL